MISKTKLKKIKRERQEEFVEALAEFLGGSNQIIMSIALNEMKGQGMIGQVAKIWAKVRANTPLVGYPDIEETKKQLKEFLDLDKEIK